MSDDLTSKIEKDRSEPSQPSAVPRIDDVMIYMFVSNLHDGKVWADYQLLKNFFTNLQHDPKEWATTAVQEMLDRIVIDRDIDHALTRVMSFSGFSYVSEVGNDYLYADAEEVEKILGEHFSKLATNDQAAFMEISQRYGALLKKIGRYTMCKSEPPISIAKDFSLIPNPNRPIIGGQIDSIWFYAGEHVECGDTAIYTKQGNENILTCRGCDAAVAFPLRVGTYKALAELPDGDLRVVRPARTGITRPSTMPITI